MRKYLVGWHWYLVLLVFVLGCSQKHSKDPQDPFEPYNQVVYRLNMSLNDNLFNPIAIGYKRILPVFVRERISDFLYFANTPIYSLCYFFAGDAKNTLKSVATFAINFLFGFLGTVNVAEKIGIAPKSTSFEDTLKSWGAKSGAYIMLPFIGPSSPRGILSLVMGFFGNPTYYVMSPNNRNLISVGLYFVDMISYKVNILDMERELRKNSADFYVTLRSIYMQHANNNIDNMDELYIEENDL